MSTIFEKVDKYFKEQNLDDPNQFEFDGNYYKDKTFCFDSHEVGKNCFLSSEDKKNFDLVKSFKRYDWIQKWKSGWSVDNFSFENFNIDTNELNSCISFINKNHEDFDLNPNCVNNLEELKQLLRDKIDKYDFISEIFDIIFSEKIYNTIYRNNNEKYIEEYRNLFEYKKISEMKNYNNYKIFENNIDCTNIKQGCLGTCYLLETISTLSNYGKLLYQIFPCEKINDNGIYEICIFHEGQWQKVLVDDYFIFYKGSTSFAFTKPVNNCLYSCLIEKAYAKIKGSFADINGGLLEDAFKALTGFEAFYISNNHFKLHNNIYDFLINKIKEGYIFSCCTKNHAYSLINIIKENNDIIFQLRNPWSSLSEKEEKLFNEFLSEYQDYRGNREENENNEGIFFLDKNRFESYFKGGISICPIILNANIYSYKLNDIPNLNINQILFFKLKISHTSKITVGINGTNNFYATTKIINENNSEKNVKIASNISSDFLRNLNNIENYEIYTEIPESTQLLKIDLTRIPLNIIQNKILTIAIQGTVDIFDFLGCSFNEPNINSVPLELNCLHYKYGTKTLKSLTQKNNAIKALEEDNTIFINPDSKGFHREKVFTNEFKLTFNLEKKSIPVELDICSETNLGDSSASIQTEQSEYSEGANKRVKNKKVIDDNDDNSNMDENRSVFQRSSKIYRNLLQNINPGFTSSHVFHEHRLKYTNQIKRYTCNFCLRIFNNYQPTFHCRRCNYDLCIHCMNIKEYDSFFQNMKISGKIIKEFNSLNKVVNCGFHIHDLKKENVYNNNGFICDLCFLAFNLPEAYHCHQCNFDLCDNCLENYEIDENTLKQLILNDKVIEVILGFQYLWYKNNPILDIIFLNHIPAPLDVLLPVIFGVDKFFEFKQPYFLIKTKRNSFLIVEYGKINEEQKEIIFNGKPYKAFYPNFSNEINHNYFNAKNREGVRVIEMDEDSYVQLTKNLFNLKFESNKYKRLYDILKAIEETHPERGDCYDSCSFSSQLIRLINGKLDYNKEFNKKKLSFIPKECLDKLI